MGVLFILFTLTGMIEAISHYCPLECGELTKHLVCEHGKNNFNDKCPANTKMININPYKELILQMHNEERNIVAGGSVPGLPKAMRMGEVKWNDELAELAEFFARLCVLENTKCTRTKTFLHPGHSSNMRIYRKSGQRQEHFIEDSIDEWLDLSPFMTADIIKSFPHESVQNLGYYARMLVQENNRIGCAATEWSSPEEGRIFHLVCFYPKTVRIGRQLYKTGFTAIECQSGLSHNYPNLCSVEENYTAPSQLGLMLL